MIYFECSSMCAFICNPLHWHWHHMLIRNLFIEFKWGKCTKTNKQCYYWHNQIKVDNAILTTIKESEKTKKKHTHNNRKPDKNVVYIECTHCTVFESLKIITAVPLFQIKWSFTQKIRLFLSWMEFCSTEKKQTT